jgi:hypothetical protein
MFEFRVPRFGSVNGVLNPLVSPLSDQISLAQEFTGSSGPTGYRFADSSEQSRWTGVDFYSTTNYFHSAN